MIQMVLYGVLERAEIVTKISFYLHKKTNKLVHGKTGIQETKIIKFFMDGKTFIERF